MRREPSDDLLIEVCSREEAGAILTSPERRAGIVLLISISDEGQDPPEGYESIENKVRLLFLDRDDALGPREEHVRQLIEVARTLSTSDRVLIHCLAGISRSTAAAVILRAVILGPGREEEAVAAVMAQRSGAWPNRRMIAYADRLLGREGRLVSAVAAALYGDNIIGRVWYGFVSLA
jgi:predicted protein tyrosine phosphatase